VATEARAAAVRASGKKNMYIFHLFGFPSSVYLELLSLIPVAYAHLITVLDLDIDGEP
jgi:hypothetical protein